VSTSIHATAIVHPSAIVAADVAIGPYAIVEARARLGAGTRIAAHAIVGEDCVIGDACVVHSFAVVGGAPQLKADSASSASGGACVIGARNVIREHATVHRGTGGGETRIGDDNLLMVGVHLGHDAVFGSHGIVANGVQIAGHAIIGDYVTFGGLAALGPHVRVGDLALVAAGAMCERDVPPFLIAQGDRARIRGVNRVGMKRRGMSLEDIRDVERAFRALYGKGRGAALVQARSFEPKSEASRKLVEAALRNEQGLFASVRAGKHLVRSSL